MLFKDSTFFFIWKGELLLTYVEAHVQPREYKCSFDDQASYSPPPLSPSQPPIYFICEKSFHLLWISLQRQQQKMSLLNIPTVLSSPPPPPPFFAFVYVIDAPIFCNQHVSLVLLARTKKVTHGWLLARSQGNDIRNRMTTIPFRVKNDKNVRNQEELK